MVDSQDSLIHLLEMIEAHHGFEIEGQWVIVHGAACGTVSEWRTIQALVSAAESSNQQQKLLAQGWQEGYDAACDRESHDWGIDNPYADKHAEI